MPRTIVAHSAPIWLPLTQTWMYNQIVHLPDWVESHILCERKENLDQFGIPRIHSLEDQPKWQQVMDRGIRKIGFRRHLDFLIRQSERIGAQILHCHFGNVGWSDSEAARRAGLKHVVTFYGMDVNYLPRTDPRWRDRYKELFGSADRILCEGPFMGRSIENLGCPRQKIDVQHLGVDLSKIPYQPRLWKTGEPFRVLLAASFREKKGIPYALEALGELKEEVDMEITLIGEADSTDRSQSEKKRILDTIEKCGLCGIVRMIGYQSYAVFLEEAYRHHLFLSPSVTADDGDTEGGAPVTLIEVAASGMPIVSTRHCDIPEVIEDGVTGLLAEERNVGGIVEHIRWLLEHTDRWEEMVLAGRRRMESEFDVRPLAQRLSHFYLGLLS